MTLIKVTIDSGQNVIPKRVDYLQNRARMLDAKISSSSMMLSSLIVAKLDSKLGDKARNFDVQISPHGAGIKVTLASKDYKGKFIYYGTKAHHIYSSSQAMPMPDGGFARSANHPGTHPMKTEVDAAVKEAVAEMRARIRFGS